MDRKETPSLKRAARYLGRPGRTYFDLQDRTDFDAMCEYTVNSINVLAHHLDSDSPPIPDYRRSDSVRHAAEAAMRALQVVAAENPQIAEAIQSAAWLFMSSWAFAAAGITNTTAEKEIATIGPLARVNAAKAAARGRAKIIATNLWQADSSKQIRIGEMADRVYRALADEGFTGVLPETSERLKEWVKPVAPEYACRAGRSRKTS